MPLILPGTTTGRQLIALVNALRADGLRIVFKVS